MSYRILGNTGLNVSEIGLGTWAMGGDEWGKSDDRESMKVIRKAMAGGINLIDTADVYGYGHSEEIICQAIAGHRQEIILVTKGGNHIYGDKIPGGSGKIFTPDYLIRAIEGSLSRLGTDHVDIYLLHNPSMEVLKQGEALGKLFDLKKEGKIKVVGVSVYTAEEATTAIEHGHAQVIMITYNMLQQTPRLELFPYCTENHVGVLVRSPLATSLLSGKLRSETEFVEGDNRKNRGQIWLDSGLKKVEKLRFLEGKNRSLVQSALLFVLAQKVVSSVVTGCRSMPQLDAALATLTGRPLSAEELDKVYELFQSNFG